MRGRSKKSHVNNLDALVVPSWSGGLGFTLIREGIIISNGWALSHHTACDTIWAALGRCATAARQPLELIILVRIQAPQPEFPACKRGLSRSFQWGLSRSFQRSLSRDSQRDFFPVNGPWAALQAAQAHFISASSQPLSRLFGKLRRRQAG
jgi:hypothetical protein